MILIETDVILSSINIKDPKHYEAEKVLEKFSGKTLLSPYTLLEINLLIKSKLIKVKNTELFWNEIGNMLAYYGIIILNTKPKYHSLAYSLREKYGLTYFDSLHAASAICEKVSLISYDSEYDKVTELNYVHPSNIV